MWTLLYSISYPIYRVAALLIFIIVGVSRSYKENIQGTAAVTTTAFLKTPLVILQVRLNLGY